MRIATRKKLFSKTINADKRNGEHNAQIIRSVLAELKKAKALLESLGMPTAEIDAKAGEVSATCELTVNAKVMPATGITLDKTTAELAEGETLTLTATVTPEDATDKTVTWTSSDETVATVVDGVVTALKAGKATITAKAEKAYAKRKTDLEKAVLLCGKWDINISQYLTEYLT